jgi:SGNH hydrolase-like domain, acetyltransferase AlgX
MSTARADPLHLPQVPPPAAATHPRRDRVIAWLFAIAVALPGLAVFATAGRTTTQYENRAAAAWPDLSAALPLREYAAAFERAFTDRFGGRDVLVRLHHAVLVGVLHTSPVPEVVLGSENWLFLTPGYKEFGAELSSAQRMPRSRDYASIVAAIGRRIQYLDAAGIAYLLVIVPDKQTIYPEYFPEALRAQRRDSLLDAVLAHLPAQWRPHVLDLRVPLLAAKAQRQVYFRTDTHWNLTGGWVGYVAILAHLPDARGTPAGVAEMPPIIAKGNVSGDLALMLGLPGWFAEPDFAAARGGRAWQCARTAAGEMPVWDAQRQALFCPSATRAGVAIHHDSAGLPLLPWLPGEFQVSRWVRGREWNLDALAADKPVLLIDEVVERNLPVLADTAFLDRPAAPVSAAPPPAR